MEKHLQETNARLAEVVNRDNVAIAKVNTVKSDEPAVWTITGNIESNFDYVVIKNNSTNEEMTGEELTQKLQWKFVCKT